MTTKRTRFTDDQRRDVASMVIDTGMTYANAATVAGVSAHTVRVWVGFPKLSIS